MQNWKRKHVVKSPTQPLFGSSLRDDPNKGCVADYLTIRLMSSRFLSRDS